jgi:hypothetical protein
MPIKVKPDSEQLLQLRHCAKIDADSLTNLAIKLSNLADPPLLPDQLLKEIKKTLSDDDAEALLPPLLSMGMIARSSDTKSVDVVKAFRGVFETPAEQSDWDRVAASIQTLIESSAIRLVTKAMQLSYDYANLLRKAHIVTDLRPLFDESGNSVEAAVVTHTLRVAYHSDDGAHDISLAMDLKDIRNLKEQCERAISKAMCIREEFANATKKPCLISGDVEKDNE